MRKTGPRTTTPFPEGAESGHIAWYPEGRCYLNLAGMYNYLELPYYVSQLYEDKGLPVHPTCHEMLDAYIVPVFLEKAKLLGLDVPDYYISNGYFEPPVIIDPINPFIIRSRIVWKTGREDSIARSMTRNFTYSMCCQDIPADGRVVQFRSIIGWSVLKKYRKISRAIWEHFKVPLATIRLIVTPDGRFLISDLSPLHLSSLNTREKLYLEKHVQWVK